jgi:hypothetical protein
MGVHFPLSDFEQRILADPNVLGMMYTLNFRSAQLSIVYHPVNRVRQHRIPKGQGFIAATTTILTGRAPGAS